MTKNQDPLKKIYLLLYVDDIILMGPDEYSCIKVREWLGRKFDLTTGDLSKYLGMNLEVNPGRITLSLLKYISKSIVEDFGITAKSKRNVPISKNPNKTKEQQDLKVALEKKGLSTAVNLRDY